MNELLKRIVDYGFARPVYVGLSVSVLGLIASLIIGISYIHTIQDLNTQQRALTAQLQEAGDLLRLARDRQATAKALQPVLRPLCGGLPPVPDAFVRSMHGWPGLSVKVNNTLDTYATTALKAGATRRANAGGLHLVVDGTESGMLSFLVDVDGPKAPIRRTVTIADLTRDKATSDDSQHPADRDRVNANVELRVVMVDPSLCNDLFSVATELLLIPHSTAQPMPAQPSSTQVPTASPVAPMPGKTTGGMPMRYDADKRAWVPDPTLAQPKTQPSPRAARMQRAITADHDTHALTKSVKVPASPNSRMSPSSLPSILPSPTGNTATVPPWANLPGASAPPPGAASRTPLSATARPPHPTGAATSAGVHLPVGNGGVL